MRLDLAMSTSTSTSTYTQSYTSTLTSTCTIHVRIEASTSVLGVLSIHIHVLMQALSLNSRVLSGMYLLPDEYTHTIYIHIRIYLHTYCICICICGFCLFFVSKIYCFICFAKSAFKTHTNRLGEVKASFKQVHGEGKKLKGAVVRGYSQHSQFSFSYFSDVSDISSSKWPKQWHNV